jgi:hypothetical protein
MTITNGEFDNLKIELTELFKNQNNTLDFSDTIYSKDQFNPFEEHGDADRNEIIYINSEFEPSTDKEVNNLVLHYYLKPSGSEAFNELLKKYNLVYYWGDVCYGFISEKEEQE